MTLNIERPCLHVPVTRDGQGVGTLVLYPDDTAFLEQFYALGQKLAQRRNQLDADLPPEQALKAMSDLSRAIRTDIDDTFGDGTSELVFGPKGCSPATLEQFFEGVSLALAESRQAILNEYLPAATDGQTALEDAT